MNDDLEAIDGLCAKIIEQRTRIEQLEAECFKLAAYQCNHGYGDDYGHFRCARIEELEAALKWIADIADKQFEQDHKLRSEGARTLKRISDRARENL